MQLKYLQKIPFQMPICKSMESISCVCRVNRPAATEMTEPAATLDLLKDTSFHSPPAQYCSHIHKSCSLWVLCTIGQLYITWFYNNVREHSYIPYWTQQYFHLYPFSLELKKRNLWLNFTWPHIVSAVIGWTQVDF